MRKKRSDAGLSRIDMSQRDLSFTRRSNLLNKIDAYEKKAKYDPEYKRYLAEYRKQIQKGFTMERILSRTEYNLIQKQSERQGGRMSVKEAVKKQTLQLTGREIEAYEKALEALEKDWGKETFDDLTVDAKKRLNKYFNMTREERRRYLQGTEGELFRYDAFEGFASLGRYYRQNSPD